MTLLTGGIELQASFCVLQGDFQRITDAVGLQNDAVREDFAVDRPPQSIVGVDPEGLGILTVQSRPTQTISGA